MRNGGIWGKRQAAAWSLAGTLLAPATVVATTASPYAMMLAAGSGGTRDMRQALQLLERTCSTGYSPACADAKRLRPQLR
jgi:hypothetical protein